VISYLIELYHSLISSIGLHSAEQCDLFYDIWGRKTRLDTKLKEGLVEHIANGAEN
jgi:hypothetical protein